ncbi:hypothetical protein KEM52_003291 [Ascosphaera acerosa]|nr:hypothetical protein KEM52_003291 [Ascosphaera acerosa]
MEGLRWSGRIAGAGALDAGGNENGRSSSVDTALQILLCGGIAGIATWASVFPLDVVKTRLQAQPDPTIPSRGGAGPSPATC